jgi:hypothetical protein
VRIDRFTVIRASILERHVPMQHVRYCGLLAVTHTYTGNCVVEVQRRQELKL